MAKSAENRPGEATIPSPNSRGIGAVALTVLVGVLLLFFYRSFAPELAIFSNDGPLGVNMADYTQMPEGMTGLWQDLTWVGGHVGTFLPTFTYLLLWVLGPVGFAKLYTPLCLLILAGSAWLLFRSLRFTPAVCLLGALAAMLNTDLFSYTAWGLGTHAVAVATAFLALAALVSPLPLWPRCALGGIAVGIGVMEGFDNGAILSVYVAVFVVFQAWDQAGPTVRRLVGGFARVAVVALAAVWVSAYALHALVGTQIKGVAGMEQDAATKAYRWDEATRWSLPKIETFRLMIAGLHGYRMDTAEGGNYWGAVGRDPAWENYLAQPSPDPAQAPNPAGLRHSGAGFYTGIFVVLLALWALAQAARGQQSVLAATQRRWVWFWAGSALVSLLLAYGRHAPFYQVVYALPYFSTIRNPIKFLHPFSLSMVILCGYGLQALLARVTSQGVAPAGGWSWSSWWSQANGFDRRFVLSCGAAVIAALVGWMIYASSQTNLVQHLQLRGFPDQAFAREIAGHSVREVGWFVLFLALSAGWIVLVLAGFFRGSRAALVSAIVGGTVLVADLGRANAPWVVYYDYTEKYASNEVIDLLSVQAHERRVALLPLNAGPQAAQALQLLQQVYGLDWMQHLFPFYNIPSLDIVQEPRPAADNLRYREAFFSADQLVAVQRRMRQWELTSTRYLISLAGAEQALDEQLDAGRGRFRLLTGFHFDQAPGGGPILATTNNVGPFGVVEFTGALPKASLYTQWEVINDPDRMLERLIDPAFDPAGTLLLEKQPPFAANSSETTSTNAARGEVTFTHYEPKQVRLKVDAEAPSVLLLNDKYHPDWEVRIDGVPAELLRANYLMRGVALTAGEHEVTFAFRPSTGMLYLSLTAIALALGLCAYLARISHRV